MNNPKVELHIANYGVITLELDPGKAPKTVANFLSYVNKGHYNNTIFHRVIPGFMVQGGGMEPGMKEKKGDKPIDNEANNGLKNLSTTPWPWHAPAIRIRPPRSSSSTWQTTVF